ncbi:hypothetical protein REISMN_04080 [Rickettsia tamurae subsp. buchneri]|uniref:Uncharacterized protein n=1 Tax=Rickettsia tamurae subsp. buchneri TaxID=1462938 RepID=A0A8E1C029_9RICK|nr:hypothetical protein REISMN_04080 [Rickettsia tamurae subsp. buchneri]
MKKILAQPPKSLDHSIYIDNNKNISNKSRCSESTIFPNQQKPTLHDQKLLQDQ